MLKNFRARLRGKVSRALDVFACWTLTLIVVALIPAILWVVGSGVQSFLSLFGFRF